MPDALDMILHWVLPTDCAVCTRRAADRRPQFFCREWWETIRPIEGSVCPRCGRPFDSPLALTSSPGHLCGSCRKKLPVFDRALSPYRYEGVLEKALHLFKYRRRDALATPLADLMLVWVDKLPSVSLVMPVPSIQAACAAASSTRRCCWRIGSPTGSASRCRLSNSCGSARPGPRQNWTARNAPGTCGAPLPCRTRPAWPASGCSWWTTS